MRSFNMRWQHLLAASVIFTCSSVSSAQVLSKEAWGLGSGYGIEAVPALEAMRAKCATSGVVVAVVDTGIDSNHPALSHSLWNNPKATPNKAHKDSHGNTFVNDLHGWDFVLKTGKLTDSHGHGSHIAGIISGDGKDYKGVCPGVKIMALRYYNPTGSGEDNLKNTVAAFNYAVENGASIINYSGGGAEFAKEEYEAIQRAQKAGILVVAAAGNEHSNADYRLYFPSAYNLPNILSVTAIDKNGQILPSSNWGKARVHVAAPGQGILSTLPNGGYGLMSGTSQATAFVTGVAAMLLSEDHSLSFEKLKSLIEASAKPYKQLADKNKTGAKVDALAAINLLHGGMKTAAPVLASAKKSPRTLALASKVSRMSKVRSSRKSPEPSSSLGPTKLITAPATR